jgi:hypothetical protein
MEKLKRAFEILDSAMIEKFRETVDLKVQLERGDSITVYLETKKSKEDSHYPAVVWQAKGFQIKSSRDRPPLGHKLNTFVDKWFGDEIFKRACVELLSESFDVLDHCMVQQVEFDRGAEVIVLDHSYGAQKKVTLKKLLGECIFSNSFSFEDTEGGFWLARDILAMF